MKTRKQLFMSLLLLGVAISVAAQQKNKQTFFASVDPKEANMVIFDIPGEMELEVWDEPYIQVFITIETNEAAADITEQLMMADRYALQHRLNHFYHLELSFPNLQKEISINGKRLKEQFVYKAKVPSWLDVEVHAKNDMVVFHEPHDNYYDPVPGNLLTLTQIKQ